MLIVSKFHDYYDTAIATGVDKTVVYIRKTTEPVECPSELTELADLRAAAWRAIKPSGWEAMFIGYCGRVYPILVYRAFGKPPVLLGSFDEVAERDRNNSMIDNRFQSKSRAIKAIRDFFAISHSDKFNNYFLDNKVVCFAVVGYFSRSIETTYIVNPNLRELGFYKVIDAFTAFQEISMFIGGILGSPNKPICEIADVDILEGKGFDKVTSFRKAPSGK